MEAETEPLETKGASEQPSGHTTRAYHQCEISRSLGQCRLNQPQTTQPQTDISPGLVVFH